MAKTVPALAGLDLDVIGLIELQNNGFGPGSAVADVVARMQAATGHPWAFEDGHGGRFLTGVVHLRSKGGSPCDIGDQGDGQGNCNVMRTNAVNELLAWLDTDPTDTGEADILLIGDFNSYAMEDPMRALEGAGYTNLVTTQLGATAYSFAFDGEWGYLDHALASPSLLPQVTGTAIWHINTDEPNVLGYSTAFKSPSQLTTLYSPDPYRASDHDPVLVGLDLVPAVSAGFGGFVPPLSHRGEPYRIRAGRTLPLRFTLGGDLGLDLFAPGFPVSREVSCTTGEAVGVPAPILQPGGSGLTYSAGNATYRLNWSTESGWGGTCRELIVRFRDSSQITATFGFRR